MGIWIGNDSAATQAGQASAYGIGGQQLYVDSTSKQISTVNSAGTVVNLQKAASVGTLSTPLNPTGTTNTTGLMMGLNQTMTPVKSGNVLVTICGVVANSTTADGATWQIRAGTGGAPANAAALTGTAYGSLQAMTYLTGVLKVPFSVTALITGLTIGTAIWIDMSLAAVTGGTATATSVAVSAVEV